MPDVIFWGATGQARVLFEAIDSTTMTLVAIVDNKKLKHSPISNMPLLHGQLGLNTWLNQRSSSSLLYFAVAIGGEYGKARLEIMGDLHKQGMKPLSIIHQTAFVANNSLIGEGCQILAMAAVCTNVKMGKGVIVNTAASVDHDCVLGNGIHIAPGARLAGEVIVENRVFIGAGAIILPRIRIGENAVVGAGAVVTKNVPPGTTVIGNPAQIINIKKVDFNEVKNGSN